MTPEQLQTAKEIFHRALDCDPERVPAFLETECHGDETLRREVEAFLSAHQQAGDFIETSVAGLAANIIDKEQSSLLAGQTIGHYKISKRIDAGGMGEVYLASDIIVGRKAALKLLPANLVADAQRLKRFQQEARVVAGLNHPNILTVYEVGADNSTHYIASELIEGETLRQRITRGRLQPGEAVEIAIQVAGALAAAHSAGVVHRDIKPENIMLRPDGYVKVLDFGIAKLAQEDAPVTVLKSGAANLIETNVGTILGTIRYMSPEQARGERVDKRTDIWSLGVVLYEMITGRTPFSGDSPAEVIEAILTKKPLPLISYVAKAPGDLQQIVTKALQKDPKQRYSEANQLLEALKGVRHRLEVLAELERSVGRRVSLRLKRSPIALAVLTLACALALAFGFYSLRNRTVSLVPEKSIAVLPFENLSRDPDNAFFADGVQDELLTDLTRIADLKVISRSSVMAYKSRATRNLHKIGQQLGVAHVMEGSVRRSGDRVRVSVQLIDANTGRHIWGRNYDATLADSLTLQGELATEIAAAVGATLSPQERARVTAKPTNNVAAYDAYLRGRVFASANNDLEKALDSYRQAVELDPDFALAWARLSSMQSQAHWQLDSDPKRVAAAKAGVDQALALDPHLPEVHFAVGYYRYYVQRDFRGALAELRQAEQALPNDSDVVKTIAFIQRRLGQWDEALRGLRRAIELDPRDIDGYHNLALTYEALRRFPEALATVDRALAWELMDRRSEDLLCMKVDILLATGDLQTLGSLPGRTADTTRFISAGYALLERRYADAKDMLSRTLANKTIAMSSTDSIENRGTLLLVLGLTQQRAGDIAAASATYQQVVQNARRILETVSSGSSAEAEAHANLGWAYAGLGQRDSAVVEGQRATAIIPSSKDAFLGPKYEENIARIYALLGDADHAIPILKRLLHISYLVPLTPAKLRINPILEGISSDPRFQELIAEKAR